MMQATTVINEKVQKTVSAGKRQLIGYLLPKALTNRYLRGKLLKQIDSLAYKTMVQENERNLKAVQLKKYEFMSAMLYSALRNIDKGYISEGVIKKLVQIFVRNLFTDKKQAQTAPKFKEKYGMEPPTFIVLSPTQRCNLHCSGCYAASSAGTPATLPYEVVDRIVGETHDIFGSHFMTISGGEPLLYRDKGKTLFDIWEKYDDMFFLFYTNGTLIDKTTAKKLAQLGNVTPAISVEGFEKETDERRGRGVFKRILQAFSNLREEGVPFGISVTGTAKNVDILLGDRFYDYYFKEQGATYMWQFQLMPNGRAEEMQELMIPPAKRVELYHKWKELLREKICVADFWNSAALSDGCIAYGREGGYFHIDWHGNIMPCVFIPYYVDNIIELYQQGKTIADALFSEFFKRGRKWQDDYGFKKRKTPENWLAPCSIRDHYRTFRESVLPPHAKPEDEHAKQALLSTEYFETLDKYDEELSELTKGLWQNEYLEPEKDKNLWSKLGSSK